MAYRHAADGEGDDCFVVAVYHAVDILVPLVRLTVYEPLGVSLGCIFVHRAGVFDVVFFYVLSARDQGWCQGLGDEEGSRVLRVPHADVAVRIQYILVVENVVCGNQGAEEGGGGWGAGFEKGGAGIGGHFGGCSLGAMAWYAISHMFNDYKHAFVTRRRQCRRQAGPLKVVCSRWMAGQMLMHHDECGVFDETDNKTEIGIEEGSEIFRGI